MLNGAFNFRESESMKKTPVGAIFHWYSLVPEKGLKVYIGELTHPVGDERLLYHW